MTHGRGKYDVILQEANTAGHYVGGVQTVDKVSGMHRRAAVLRFLSAGGSVYVAEEQQNVASYINLRP